MPRHVVAAVQHRAVDARLHLDATIERRRRVHERLSRSADPNDQAIARTYLDYLRQADDVRRSRAALTLAAGPEGDPVVGRLAVFDDDRNAALVSWHSPEGQRQLLADDRLLVSERPDGTVSLHALSANDRDLAERVRHRMRVSARQEEMSDPLATLTVEQAGVLRQIGGAAGSVLLHGPPGSGKSAIVMVELARRVLSDPDPARFRALFVTGTHRLAHRAASLARMLGTASITPIPQDDLLRFLSIADEHTPQAGADATAADTRLPGAIEAAFQELQSRLLLDTDIPHPLGAVPADEVQAVRHWRARARSTSYAEVARGLLDDLRAEYESIVPGASSRRAAEDATSILRPRTTPNQLLTRALAGERLPRPLRAVAIAGATDLLTRRAGGAAQRWDLVVVDEYQRLPGLVLWLLRRAAVRVVLSGDPLQSFSPMAEVAGDAGQVSLRTSLRMPVRISRWIDDTWSSHGLAPPAIPCAADGGTVVLHHDEQALPPGSQVIAPATQARRHPDWLGPPEAVGLEWPDVTLIDPAGILHEHGPPGLFIAASRAIDTLNVIEPAGPS